MCVTCGVCVGGVGVGEGGDRGVDIILFKYYQKHQPRSQSSKSCLSHTGEVPDYWVSYGIPNSSGKHYDENVNWIQLGKIESELNVDNNNGCQFDKFHLQWPPPEEIYLSRSQRPCCTLHRALHQHQMQSSSILAA